MRELLHSVKCMHELGIIHRDLKLDNVMIQEVPQPEPTNEASELTTAKKFEVRIIDFGLSIHHDPSSISKEEDKKLKALVGTPSYIAPEIIKQAYDEKCDIWSLGVIAYQLFSQGEYPFDGANEIQIYTRICKGKFFLPDKQSETDKYSPQDSRRRLRRRQRRNQDRKGYDWTYMSEEAKDFIKSLLTKNPQKRLSARQALAHPWLNFESCSTSYLTKYTKNQFLNR